MSLRSEFRLFARIGLAPTLLMMVAMGLKTGCATTVSSVPEVIRTECVENKGGVLRVQYNKYVSGWEVEEVECWYGVAPEAVDVVMKLEDK